MSAIDILKARVAYADRGWSTFPVPSGTKRSHIAGKAKGGERWGATKDVQIFEKWASRWPDAGIGLPTSVENGIWVLEVDTPAGHGVDGASSLADLAAKNGRLPATLMARSPSGSMHYYFRRPADGVKILNSAGAVGAGIDVRGDGGMVVAPPTQRKGGKYVWVSEGQAVAYAPPWLLALVTTKIRQNAPAAAAGASNTFTAYGEHAGPPRGPNAAEVLNLMSPGNIHASQVKATAILLNGGATRNEAIEVTLCATQKQPGTDGWDWDEERASIASMCDTWLDRLRGEQKAEDAAIGDMPSGEFVFGQVYAKDDWLYGHHIMRGEVAGSAAPGGVGKSTLAIVEALAMASGKDLVGQAVVKPLSVLLINLEDNIVRMGKRIEAAMRKHGITEDDLGGRLRVWAKGEVNFVIATATKNTGEVKRQDAFFSRLLAYVREHHIDAVSVDPFVRTHQIAENDNVAIAKVVSFFEQLAQQGNCGVSLWHHTRKMLGDGASPTVDSARGASSFVDACRSVRVLETMSEKQATQLGVDERRRIFSCYSGKLNYAPPIEESEWYYIDSVKLDGGLNNLGDETVGVVKHYNLPASKEMTIEQIAAIRAAIDGEPRWRDSVRADMWVGNAIAPHVGTDKPAQLKTIISDLINKKILRKLEWKDAHHEKRLFIIVVDGNWRPPQ